MATEPLEMRHDIIRGETVLRDQGGIRILYEGSRCALAEALEEKKDAVETVRRMRQIFESAKSATS